MTIRLASLPMLIASICQLEGAFAPSYFLISNHTMMLFPHLSKTEYWHWPEAPVNSVYLWQKVQSDVQRLTPIIEDNLRNKVKQLQSDKKRMIFERLGTRNYEHPSFNGIDFSDEASIHRFLAQENIKCALICDPFQTLEQLSILCDIITDEYNKNIVYPHISIFRWYDKAKSRWDSREDLITYFKVNLFSEKQNIDIRAEVIKELESIIL